MYVYLFTNIIHTYTYMYTYALYIHIYISDPRHTECSNLKEARKLMTICMSCHKAIMVKTGRIHCFHDFIYIYRERERERRERQIACFVDLGKYDFRQKYFDTYPY